MVVSQYTVKRVCTTSMVYGTERQRLSNLLVVLMRQKCVLSISLYKWGRFLLYIIAIP